MKTVLRCRPSCSSRTTACCAMPIRRELSRGGFRSTYLAQPCVESIERCCAGYVAASGSRMHGSALCTAKWGRRRSQRSMNDTWRIGEIDISGSATDPSSETRPASTSRHANHAHHRERGQTWVWPQLHQIRGRVGRASRHAYAYLCYRHGQGTERGIAAEAPVGHHSRVTRRSVGLQDRHWRDLDDPRRGQTWSARSSRPHDAARLRPVPQAASRRPCRMKRAETPKPAAWTAPP